MNETELREEICLLSKSLFDRGYTHGSTGNISARCSDGGLLVSPTGACFGRLDPAKLSRFDAKGNHISGDKPTKELPLHMAFFDTRPQAGAVVHLHSSHCVAVSMLPNQNEDNFLPAITPYAIMLLGKVKLLPFFLPGDEAIGQAVYELKGTRAAVMLANHGPVVSAETVAKACYAIEEMEETAKLVMMTRGNPVQTLSEDQIRDLVVRYNVEWDD